MSTLNVIAKTRHGTRDGVLTDDSGSPVLDGTPFSPEDLRAHIMPVNPPDSEVIAMLALQRKVTPSACPCCVRRGRRDLGHLRSWWVSAGRIRVRCSAQVIARDSQGDTP